MPLANVSSSGWKLLSKCLDYMTALLSYINSVVLELVLELYFSIGLCQTFVLPDNAVLLLGQHCPVLANQFYSKWADLVYSTTLFDLQTNHLAFFLSYLEIQELLSMRTFHRSYVVLQQPWALLIAAQSPGCISSHQYNLIDLNMPSPVSNMLFCITLFNTWASEAKNWVFLPHIKIT